MLQISPQNTGSAENQKNVSFEAPIDLLLSCHEKILHFSSTLVELSTVLEKEGWSNELTTTSDQIRRYFNIASPEHHLDEEHHLFPAIIALDPELTQPESIEILQLLNRLIKEHVESDAQWQSLNKMLEEKTEDFEALKKLSLQFKNNMHEHAAIENEHIFPYAKAHISEKELKKIGLEIAERRGIAKPDKSKGG